MRWVLAPRQLDLQDAQSDESHSLQTDIFCYTQPCLISLLSGSAAGAMKFGHELLALEESCPKEFSGRFLKYKELKKLIKRIREMEAEGSTDSPEEREFLTLLNAEVASVNRCAVWRRRLAAVCARCRTCMQSAHCDALTANLALLLQRPLLHARQARWRTIWCSTAGPMWHLDSVLCCDGRTFEQHAQQVVHAAARKRRPRRSCCLPSFRKSSGGLKVRTRVNSVMGACCIQPSVLRPDL